ncbi:MAG: hypothetical protein ACFFAO_21875, partial [Candidatus Hermodarchaeota archaeon]
MEKYAFTKNILKIIVLFFKFRRKSSDYFADWNSKKQSPNTKRFGWLTALRSVEKKIPITKVKKLRIDRKDRIVQ